MNIENILVESFSVSEIDIEKAKSYQQKYGGRLEKLLVNMGSLSDERLPHFYSKLLNLPLVDELAELGIEFELPAWSNELKLDLLTDKNWLPFSEKINCFITPDPLDWEINQYFLDNQITALVTVVTKDVFAACLAEIAPPQVEESTGLNEFEEDRLRELASEAPTVNLLNSLLTRGVGFKASDLHIEPIDGKYRARYRIDGVLRDEGFLPSSLSLAVLSRIKILSNMDVAEKRRPQDGKIETKISNVDLDIRVSCLPLNNGESMVMRFLRKDAVKYDMQVLGIESDLRAKILSDLKKTAGVILLTGPTGSGKTTSLYTFLNELNNDSVKIITLEDPVEYQLEGINQVQVNSEIGFDFAAGLRSIVRQDPDIIMLGEIRDKETAQIAMQSALTGHLVFSTVHTNDAPSAFTRLVDLGVEEFLLNAAIVSVLAQRLVRKVCPDCAEPISESALKKQFNIERELNALAIGNPNFVTAKGCDSCGGSGYQGRMSILEYLPCDDVIRGLDKNDYFIPHAKEHNTSLGNRTLFQDGLVKAAKGLTTIDEVLRVCA